MRSISSSGPSRNRVRSSARIDTDGIGDARLYRANGIVVEGDQQRIEDKARLVLRLHRNLPQASAQSHAVLDVASLVRMPETFDQFHQLCRQTEAIPLPGPDAKPAAISGIDKVDVFEPKIVCAGHNLIKLREETALNSQIFEHRFNHEITGSELGDVSVFLKALQQASRSADDILPRLTDCSKSNSVCFCALLRSLSAAS